MEESKAGRSKWKLLNLEEEEVNTIMFAAWMFLTIGAFIVVVIILGGPFKDWIALAVTVVGIVIRLLEKRTEWFKKYAKYAYLTLPIWCTCGLVLDNEGNFAAVTQAWFFFLSLSVAYFEVKMVVYCAGITIGSTLAAMIIFPEAMFKLDMPAIWLYIFSVYMMAFVFSIVITKRMRRLLESARQAKAYEDELVYLKLLEEKDEKHSEVIHNLNHYLVAIGELARDESCGRIVQMVEELNGKLLHNERIIYTSHRVLNAVLAEKRKEAFDQNIEYQVYVEPGIQLGNITDGDLAVMLGNLLDNALEAAGECKDEKRKLSLWIYMEKEGNICVIKMVNYFVGDRICHKGRFISTKKYRERHGIGIKSVHNIAGKYGGHIKCMFNEEKFTTVLILPVKD